MNTLQAGPLIIYALAWLLFAILHSLLARQRIQRYLEKLVGRYYRLLYNVLALVKIVIVLEVGRALLGTDRFSQFEVPALMWLSAAIQLLGFVVLLVALLFYDIGRFSGFTQIVKAEILSVSAAEPLHRRGLNRWVRHPLYTGALILMWGSATSPFLFWTAVWGSLYFLIGSFFEERKLIRLYGNDYLRYQKEVPRFFPTIRNS